MSLRGARLALSTALGLARRGFFIPYRHAGLVPPPGRRAPYGALGAALKAQEFEFRTVLAAIEGFARQFRTMKGPAPEPRFEQDWFPRLDAAAAYALVRIIAPKHILEIGTGHSTRFMARAIGDGGLDCRIITIDPEPRTSVTGLKSVELMRATLQEVGRQFLEALVPGDILFVDSSHVLMPGTDVDLILNRALPMLPSGVFVHFHDIFLPDDYPAEWAWRGYNEQLGVAQLIAAGGYRPVFASHYVASRMRDSLAFMRAATLPLLPGAYESSLWLRKL
jgi:predicted O-methyltransferase YrrM